MMGATSIEWTDYTFNPWIGCAKVSAGCTHCYAENSTPVRKSRAEGLELWGPKAARRLTSEANWALPWRWNRAAEKEGIRRRVFCASLADVFEFHEGQMVNDRGERLWWHPTDSFKKPYVCQEVEGSFLPHPEWQPYTLSQARAALWHLIQITPQLDWQLLTKRPEHMTGMTPWAEWPANVWALTSVENQEYTWRVHELLRVPARVRGLSVEPLLGPVDLTPWINCCKPDVAKRRGEDRYVGCVGKDGLHWVIIGGESGPHARPCHLDWVRALARQCQAASVACFVKQLGSNPRCPLTVSETLRWPGTAEFNDEGPILRDPKGGVLAEWPEDLRVRQFPKAKS